MESGQWEYWRFDVSEYKYEYGLWLTDDLDGVTIMY